MFLSIFSFQNNAHLLEHLVWMLGAFLIGWFFWRWWYKKQLAQNQSKELVEEQSDIEEPTTLKVRKVVADGVTDIDSKQVTTASSFVEGVAALDDSVQDDLTKVEGIGPKIKSLLNDSGIWSFRQLADASPEMLQELLNNAGPRYRIHSPTTWPAQANLAAEEKWEELASWQNELKGGR